ncbi:MAG: DUF192 domain-containing protein [Verrucomicrobiales bacterium]|nr:DUF192 domain-containing protein [Verrucomicrobiales bacterium]
MHARPSPRPEACRSGLPGAKLLLWTALLVGLSGCERSAIPAADRENAASAPVGSQAWLNNGKPQGDLPRIKLYLGAKELNTELAMTAAAIQKGMMWRTNVPESEAMIFVFSHPHQTAFWMKNVPMNIDVAYLDSEGAIQEIHRLEKQNTNPVPAKAANVQFALETAEGWFQRNGIGTGVVVRTDRGSLQDTFFRGAAAR